RPEIVLNLEEVRELRGWSRENGHVRLGAGVTYTEAAASPLSELLPALGEAARTVGSPQIRNRGTIGGNLATASPAGDALPRLLGESHAGGATSRRTRTIPLLAFLLGPKRNALEPDELIVAVQARPAKTRETFMKVGPRNAMVIAVCSLALRVDPENALVA